MLERLKDYKELIAIIIFFLSGVFWLQSTFPSKNEMKTELVSIRCLLDSYMKLTQLQILSQEQDKQVNELRQKLTQVPPDNVSGGLAISPAMRAEFEQLKLDYATSRNQLGQTTRDMAKIRDELARGVCGKVAL
ncbi:MAG: hypothetical protein PHU06_07265 [Gallionella sp.]|nr:hypothetical protein [Gallionella sp.]MDD4958473.1 hypothetical protein [Gallionella sp.]